MRGQMFIAAAAVFCAVGWTGAWAGTSYVDFSSGTGPLSVRLDGSGALTSSGGRAFFTGPNLTAVGDGGTAAACGGTLSASMTLTPATDAVNGVGLVIVDASDPENRVTAAVDGSGTIVFSDWIGIYKTGNFAYPGAGNNSMTVQYNSATERATLTINGNQSLFLDAALNGATSVWIGVFSNGTGGFAHFTGQGPCIPDYPPQLVDSDEDGVSDEDEIARGSNPEDPGHVPVFQAEGAVIHPLSGAAIVIEAGSLPQYVLVIKAGTPGLIPSGAIPEGKRASTVALSLEPDGATFSLPVQVTLPYSVSAVSGLVESSLTVVYFDGADYAADGIADVSVDTVRKEVVFTTTHFTDFLIVGSPADSDSDGIPDLDDLFPHNGFGATDSDGDGIGDEWEDRWFGDGDGEIEAGELSVANAHSDFDMDGVSDRVEFTLAPFGLDPTDGSTLLPAVTRGWLGLLGAGMALAGLWRGFGVRRKPGFGLPMGA